MNVLTTPSKANFERSLEEAHAVPVPEGDAENPNQGVPVATATPMTPTAATPVALVRQMSEGTLNSARMQLGIMPPSQDGEAPAENILEKQLEMVGSYGRRIMHSTYW